MQFFIRNSPKKIINNLNIFVNSLQKYPSDLIITVKNGLAFTNYNYPYFLWIDYHDKKKLLFVVDESASAEKIEIYNSLLLLTAKDLVFNIKPKDKKESYLKISLNHLSSLIIDKEYVNNLSNTFNSNFIKNFYLIYFLFSFIFLSFSIVFSILITLFYLLLACFANFLLYKVVINKKVHFKKIFQIGLHAITFPLFFIIF